MTTKKGGLGRGFDALFADAEPVVRPADESSAADDGGKEDGKGRRKSLSAGNSNAEKAGRSAETGSQTGGDRDGADRVHYIDINDIKPNSGQPRKKFDEVKIGELADSIRENGVIQPLIVRNTASGYELVAGERRWRASRAAGLREVPCIVRDFTDEQNMVVAIIENMQREDLDAIEEANGLQQMINNFGFTQEQVSKSLGKSRAYIANSLRLLKLPEDIRQMIIEGRLSAAHGRTLVSVEDDAVRKAIADKVVREGLSVRATERLADRAKDKVKPERRRRAQVKSPEIKSVEDELRRIMGTKVSITDDRTGEGKRGKLEIEYYSLEELNRIIDMLRELD